MRVDFSARAKKELARAIRWWMDNPGGRPPVLDAVQLAVMGIAKLPERGAPFKTMRGHQVRRLLLHSVQYYLYYRVEPHRVLVLALWATARARAPRFGPP